MTDPVWPEWGSPDWPIGRNGNPMAVRAGGEPAFPSDEWRDAYLEGRAATIGNKKAEPEFSPVAKSRAERRQERAEIVANRKKPRTNALRASGDDQTVRCPVCGGTQFKARRTKLARAAIVATVAAAAVTKQKKVQCVTCGTMYDRG